MLVIILETMAGGNGTAPDWDALNTWQIPSSQKVKASGEDVGAK